MREIEVKAKCESIQTILARVKQQGIVVSDPVSQSDQVFGLPGEAGDDENQLPWLRIRTENRGDTTRTIFTLKRSVTGQLDSIEHETEVRNADEIAHIIKELGFVPYMNIAKVRRTARLDSIELCIDEVEGLGCFVEAEKITGVDANYDEVVEELWGVFERLGISRNDQVFDGYDVLMKIKENNKQ